MGYKPWGKTETKLLIKLVEKKKLTATEIYKSGKLPNRTFASISKKISRLDVESKNEKPYNHWTNEEIWQVYIYHKQGYSRKVISEMMPGRSKHSIEGIINRKNMPYYPPRVEIPENMKSEVEAILVGEGK